MKLELWVNYNCNYNCNYCGFSKNKYTTNNLKNLEKIIIDKKFESIDMLGGEPFLYENIKNLIIRLLKLNIPINIYTNLSDTSFLKIKELQKIIQTDLIYIHCSFHPSHEKLENFVNKFKELKNLNYQINSVYMFDNNFTYLKNKIIFLKLKKEISDILIHLVYHNTKDIIYFKNNLLNDNILKKDLIMDIENLGNTRICNFHKNILVYDLKEDKIFYCTKNLLNFRLGVPSKIEEIENETLKCSENCYCDTDYIMEIIN